MQLELRSACLSIFRYIRIEAADTVRLGELKFRCAKETLVYWLQGEIYKTFFCSATSCSSPESTALFMSALSQANAGGELQPKQSFTVQSGSYMAFGRPEPPGTTWLRLYWNVSPSGAIVLTGSATGILNRLRVPFRLKVMLDTSIHRRDAAVLYVPLDLWSAARTVVKTVSERLDPSGVLHPETPLFTKTLRPGVGLAEDPQTGWSFGMHRSWLVARSLARSYMQNHASEDQQWVDLGAEFAREGLAVERAYLNNGSVDVYEF
jgi:hypothetical protein